MGEKKKYRLNCDVCDTRKMSADMFEEYDTICVNALILLVNQRSKEILKRYPVQLNVDTVVETDADVDIQTQNGAMEITPEQRMEREIILIVNGVLKIAPGSEDILKHYLHIVVNGVVRCPKSMQSCLAGMTVNGKAEIYPDDCIMLHATEVLDSYFPLRAKENAKYYARKRIVLLNEKTDAALLAEKKVQFVTPEFIVTEGMVKTVIPLLSDETRLAVVPDGCCFVNEDAVLDESLTGRENLYINGNLQLVEASMPLLAELQYLHVNGEVRLLPEQKETFLKLHAEYNSLRLCKGKRIANKLAVHVDEAMLAGAERGICLQNCVRVEISETLGAEQIKDELQIENCAEVLCTQEQYAAVESVSRNAAHITVEGRQETEELPEENANCINADNYVL